jgi:hypothetical protein
MIAASMEAARRACLSRPLRPTRLAQTSADRKAWPAPYCSFLGSLRAARNHRESASFLGAVEPTFGIVDRIRGQVGRPSSFTSVRLNPCQQVALTGLLAPARHAHTAIVEASAASAGLFSLSRAQRARAPCDQLSGSLPVFHRVCSGLLGQRKPCGR